MAKPKGYKFIEFNIYESLDWDRDKIIQALDVIRKKFCETRDLTRHGLSAHIMPRELPQKNGELYPVMGLVIPTSKYFGYFDILSITSVFDDWSSKHQISELLDEGPFIGVPCWEQLLKEETYPLDPRTLYA